MNRWKSRGRESLPATWLSSQAHRGQAKRSWSKSSVNRPMTRSSWAYWNSSTAIPSNASNAQLLNGCSGWWTPWIPRSEKHEGWTTAYCCTSTWPASIMTIIWSYYAIYPSEPSGSMWSPFTPHRTNGANAFLIDFIPVMNHPWEQPWLHFQQGQVDGSQILCTTGNIKNGWDYWQITKSRTTALSIHLSRLF